MTGVQTCALPISKRQRKPKVKIDPKYVAAARELRDRWLEELNAGQHLPEAAGKYEVGRQISAAPMAKEVLLLTAA